MCFACNPDCKNCQYDWEPFLQEHPGRKPRWTERRYVKQLCPACMAETDLMPNLNKVLSHATSSTFHGLASGMRMMSAEEFKRVLGL